MPKRKRKLNATEVSRQHAAALPEREAMSMLLPLSDLPLVPVGGADAIATGPSPDDGASDGPASGTAPEGTTTYAPEDQARAVNRLSPGAVQGSTSTQNAPIDQSS